VRIRSISEDILFVALPGEPHLGSELDEVTEMISEGCGRDVIVDFSDVAMLTSESICALMILDKYLISFGRWLVFCNASAEVKHIFARTGLESVFTFADDECAALEITRRLRVFTDEPA
jgi:anti-anti-sigma regulatory factor